MVGVFVFNCLHETLDHFKLVVKNVNKFFCQSENKLIILIYVFFTCVELAHGNWNDIWGLDLNQQV